MLYCIACYQCTCSGTCLASHRDRSCCHNPRCIFYTPCPVPQEPREQRMAQLPAPSTNDASEAEGSSADNPATSTSAHGESSSESTPGDSNEVYRDIITIEWRQVRGDGAPVNGELAASGRTTAAITNTTSAEEASLSTHVDRPSTPPATFTIEEYEAQARLLSQYQQPQGPPPQQEQRVVGTRRNGGSEQGSRRRPTIRIEFH